MDGVRHEQPGASAFRLKDLLGHEELGLNLLTGGADALDRHVAGAHVIEIERPSTWLEPDWIMLTTGARLRRSPNAQRELIAELDGAGATALGFGVELVFRTTPPALLDEARARGFPLFSVPLRTAFRDLISTVNRALLSSDLRTLQRVSSMQLYLMRRSARRIRGRRSSSGSRRSWTPRFCCSPPTAPSLLRPARRRRPRSGAR